MASKEGGMISTEISMVFLKHSIRKLVLNDQKDIKKAKIKNRVNTTIQSLFKTWSSFVYCVSCSVWITVTCNVVG